MRTRSRWLAGSWQAQSAEPTGRPLPTGSRRVWSPQLSPTSGEKGLSRTPAAFQTSAGDYVAEDNVKISIDFQKSALTKNANAALLCSVVSLGHGEMLGRRGLPLRPQRKSMVP
jgi:hypothetical protein